jgi:hypothetical protein
MQTMPQPDGPVTPGTSGSARQAATTNVDKPVMTENIGPKKNSASRIFIFGRMFCSPTGRNWGYNNSEVQSSATVGHGWTIAATCWRTKRNFWKLPEGPPKARRAVALPWTGLGRGLAGLLRAAGRWRSHERISTIGLPKL